MNLEKVLSHAFKPLEHKLLPRDCMLYALGIGYGADASAKTDLQYCYEDGLKAFPALVNVLAHPGAWITAPELEVNWVKLLHGEQSYEIFRPIEPNKTYVGHYRVKDVLDKGEGKGALLYLEKELRDKDTDERVSLVTSTYFLRGDGGCGGTTDTAPAQHTLPERAADKVISIATLPQAALIYRLSGDYNPIHADPVLAAKAGFDRPILHGLCSLALASRAVLSAYADEDPARLKSLQLRFSAPVYPGETIVTELWQDGDVISFRSKVAERDLVVLTGGRAVVGA